MPDILTKNLTGNMVPVETEPPEKMKEIITELHDVAFVKSEDQKSILISQNIEGIVQIAVYNENLKRRFGINNPVREALCMNKMRVVKSRDGNGLKTLEGVLKALKSEMNVNPAPPAPSIADIAVGKRK